MIKIKKIDCKLTTLMIRYKRHIPYIYNMPRHHSPLNFMKNSSQRKSDAISGPPPKTHHKRREFKINDETQHKDYEEFMKLIMLVTTRPERRR
tara:strand:- start:122 stop:400 length:279 start_codon:yes stop_codon:yes gene_type:complete